MTDDLTQLREAKDPFFNLWTMQRIITTHAFRVNRFQDFSGTDRIKSTLAEFPYLAFGNYVSLDICFFKLFVAYI